MTPDEELEQHERRWTRKTTTKADLLREVRRWYNESRKAWGVAAARNDRLTGLERAFEAKFAKREAELADHYAAVFEEQSRRTLEIIHALVVTKEQG